MSQQTADIVLATVNSRFQHAAFGLRYLYANLEELRDQAVLKEWSVGVRARDVVEQILSYEPKVVGLSVYIWNVHVMTDIARLLKRVRPDIVVIIGGPEVSHEWEETEIFAAADYLVRGEGEVALRDLCRALCSGERPTEKVIPGGLPLLSDLCWPYPYYSDFDLEHGRMVYVEASRGCPFQCHFCLSSLDRSVRAFDLDELLSQLDRLIERGVLQFKFVDRTFNLKATTSVRILSFFLERYRQGMFLHFEMIPDRLPAQLRPVISSFPPGVLQFEVGIQSFDPEVCNRIGRRQKFPAITENLTFLREESGVHVHADLIAGLPGEGMEGFGRGFDQLYRLGVQEIQVGILKRLRGTPITLASKEWGMVYSPMAPYEVLQTAHLSFQELQRLQRFSRYWDLTANSSRFPRLIQALLQDGSPFEQFMGFSDWLHETVQQTSGISAKRLGTSLVEYLVETRIADQKSADQWLALDTKRVTTTDLPSRQARHLAQLPTVSD